MNSSQPEISFALGQTLITAKARGLLHPHEVLAALYRHGHRNWEKEIIAPNETAIGANLPVLSAHFSSRGEAFRIITNAERDLTIVFLVEEADFSEAGSVDAWICGLACPHCG